MPVPEIASLSTNPNFLHAVRALAVDAVGAEVIAAFRAAGIPSILLKGRSIARWLYPRGGRSYGDTDVLVQEGDVVAAEAVLRRLGFVDIADEWASAEHMPHEIARTFVRPLAPERPPERGHGGKVDLHWSIHHVPRAPDVVWKTFNAHTTTLLLGDVETTALDTTALALHVVLHAAQHAKEKHTGEDLRRAVSALSAEEWAEVAALAARLGVEDLLALGLRLDRAGEAVAQALGLPDPPAEELAAWTAYAPQGANSLDMLAAAPGLGAKVRVARWVLFPSPGRVRYEFPTTGGTLGAYCRWWAMVARTAVPALRYAVSRRRRLRSGS
jgi:hypothetical protein